MTLAETPRVLVVCTGNLCRSPVAAALLGRELAAADIEAEVDSAGTGAPYLHGPDRRLLKAADEIGIDLSDHRSRPVTRALLRDADLVLTMTTAHRREVAALLPDVDARTTPLRAAAWKSQLLRGRPVPFARWVALLASDVPEAERPRIDQGNDIPDPIGRPMREYRDMVGEVARLAESLASRWSGR